MNLPAPAPVYYTRRTRAYLDELWRRREFVWFLAIGNFRARNASTALGLAWWVLNPLLLSLVYWLIFGFIFPGTRDLTYLMSGMFVFHFTSQSLTGGANSVLQNSKLLANLPFPRLILPIASLIETTIGFLVSLVLLFVLTLVLAGSIPGAGVWLLLVALPLQFVFNLGLASLAGRLAVPFRDINNFIPYLNRIWLYLSPIIWPLTFLDGVDSRLVTFAEWNPMFSIISVYRTAILDFPYDPAMLLRFAGWAGAIGLIGVGVFVKYEGKIVRHL